MDAILTQVDGWIIAALLLAAMLAAWGMGRLWGRRLAGKEREDGGGKVHDGVLALFGLMLAFTFSVSLTKHEHRRQMVVTASSALGDFYTCASLLREPVRGRLRGEIRGYVELRLALTRELNDVAQRQKAQSELEERQDRMQALVGEAVDAGTSLVAPLVNTFNEVTSSYAARLAAERDRLPPSIVLLLFLAAVAATALMGRRQGMSGKGEFAATVAFVVLVSMVVWVTLDLNQPYRGWITVSQEPLQRLLAGMAR
jgi:hypothetical protein